MDLLIWSDIINYTVAEQGVQVQVYYLDHEGGGRPSCCKRQSVAQDARRTVESSPCLKTQPAQGKDYFHFYIHLQ